MQLALNGAVVTAIEVSKRRSKILSENLLRTGLIAHIRTEDICNSKTEELYDVVLVDAPCSSTGTIRRNCDLQFLEPLKRINGLVKQQKIILKKSMQFVKTGGRLISRTMDRGARTGVTEGVCCFRMTYSKGWGLEWVAC